MIAGEVASDEDRVLGAGWSATAFGVALLGAGGGILVALCVKHADSIVKSIAVSGAIVLATACDHFLLGGPMSLSIAIGAGCAILGSQNYTNDAEKPPPDRPR